MLMPDLHSQRLYLAEMITKYSQNNANTQNLIKELTFYHLTDESQTFHETWSPGICLIASGQKRVVWGNNNIEHSASEYILMSVDLPLITQAIMATKNSPYLALRVDLDPLEIADLAIESQLPLTSASNKSSGLNIAPLHERLLDVVIRLVSLLDRPHDIPILKPLILKELAYILLTDPQGAQLRAMALTESQSQRIYKVINKIKADYKDKFKVSELAAIANMSESSLHHYFKAITSMTPLQFQKQIRLQEARKLMLKYQFEAATAAFKVGYDSPTQFSREYKRLFGNSPIRDVKANIT